jgi:hypothetical protein
LTKNFEIVGRSTRLVIIEDANHQAASNIVAAQVA